MVLYSIGGSMEKTTCLIPEELKHWAKENGVNMSFVLRKALKNMRAEQEVKDKSISHP